MVNVPNQNLHPNVHAPWSRWSNEETLHVAVAYSNPFRWQTRRELMNNFRYQMQSTPNVILHVGELAYGDRPFEVTGDDPNDIQLRTASELFHKENILNEVIKTFPAGWKYGAYSDADFTFTRHDWALETIHQLQHHEWVQPFSTYATLTANTYGGSKPEQIRDGFAALYAKNGYKLPAQVDDGGWATVPYGTNKDPAWIPVGATGGAWAFRQTSFNAVGGLLDQCILGHADWFMTFGLVSQPTRGTIAASKFHPNYTAVIAGWQERAKAAKNNIGFVDQFVTHHFHGAMKNRAYDTRDKILVDWKFDPVNDIRRNWQGVWELTGNKPGLRDAIRKYFITRDEDNPNG